MKKALFFITVVALTCNAMGQATSKTHKATGDKPLFSKTYSYGASDSIFEQISYYTYDGSQRLTKQIVNYSSSEQDSILTAYDAKGRMISINTFTDGTLSSSHVWTYDDQNSKITYLVHTDNGGGGTQPSQNTVFWGVKDMDATDIGFELSTPMGNFIIRDCDSIHLNAYETGGWNPYGVIVPTYQAGKIDQAVVTLDGAFISNTLGQFPIPIDQLVITFAFTYDGGGKLTNINGSTSVSITSPFPVNVPLNDFITVTNQYSGTLLTQTVAAIDISIPMVVSIYMGTKQVHLYNQEDNILCTENYYTEVKNNWPQGAKTWYYYEYETSVEDIAISLATQFGNSDPRGATINLSIAVQNKSELTPFSNVNVTAIVKDETGETLQETTDVISLIQANNTITHNFSESYIVPNTDQYFITIYLESQDQYMDNDTIQVTRTTYEPSSIAGVENTNMTLGQNIPNPANNSARIEYSVVEAGQVTFTLYSINGQTLLQQTEYVTEGNHQLELNTTDLANGIYFYSMDFNGKRIVKKMNVKK